MGKLTITQKKFDDVKYYKKLGMSYAQIQAMTGASTSVISRIFKSDNLDEYKAFRVYRAPQSKAEAKVSDDTLELLKQLVEEVKTIKEELALVPKRRKW